MKIGILGGGQLARMLALAAIPLGIKVRVLSEKVEESTSGILECFTGSVAEIGDLRRFADGLDQITYEFENFPTTALKELERESSVFPPVTALEKGQDREQEKRLFERCKVPTTRWRTANTPEAVISLAQEIGLPVVIKTTRLGYDGKGQWVANNTAELHAITPKLQGGPWLVEEKILFNREVSIIGVRGRDGSKRFYPLVQNFHSSGILRTTIAPAPGRTPLTSKAESYWSAIADELNYVGVLAIELFQRDEDLLANEIAPRVHNTGHWTIEGAYTSQFENHIRAVCGLALGSTDHQGFSIMQNIIGVSVLPTILDRAPNSHLHSYEKSPRPGRKVGHITTHHLDPHIVLKEATEISKILEQPFIFGGWQD